MPEFVFTSLVRFAIATFIFASLSAVVRSQYFNVSESVLPCCYFAIFRDNFMIQVYNPSVNESAVHCVHDHTDTNGDDFWIGYQCDSTADAGGFVNVDFVRWVYGANDRCQAAPIASKTNNQIDDTFHGRIQETCCLDYNTNCQPVSEFLPPHSMTPSPPTSTTTTTTTTTTTRQPSFGPTVNPTQWPSNIPTVMPSQSPTAAPTTTQPTSSPTRAPTNIPSFDPTTVPTSDPSKQPTFSPTTWAPTRPNQKHDTRPPTPSPTHSPTKIPTYSPTDDPSFLPTDNPTVSPTNNPSESPTQIPTASTINPTNYPTFSPTENPSLIPSSQPSNAPTKTPTLSVIDDGEQDVDSGDENVDHEAAVQSAIKLLRAQVMPSLPVHVLCLFFVLLFFVLLVRKFFERAKDAQRKPIQKSVKITVIVTFVSNIVGIASMLAMTSMMMTTQEWDRNAWNKSFVAISFVSVCYIVGKASLETFYILRVRNAFNDSALAMSKYTVAGLLFFLVMIALVWLFEVVIDRPEWKVFDRDYDYLILSVLDIVLVSVLLSLFVKKLSALVLMQKSECISEMSSQTSNASQETQDVVDSTEAKMHRVMSRAVTVDSVQRSLNDRQTKLIFIITRCIVLNLASFVTTILFGFFSFYYVRYGTHLYFLYSAWSLDMLINSVCLYLNFAFAGDLYSKCCGCCHSRCQKLMEYCAAKQILHEHINESAEDTNVVSVNSSSKQ